MTVVGDGLRYYDHDHRVVRLAFGGASLPELESEQVVAAPGGLDAVAALAERLRHESAGGGPWANAPDGGPLHELARGVSLGREALDDALGRDLAADLVRVGAVLADGHRWRLGFGVMALGDLYVPVPRESTRADRLYLGLEALFLEQARDALGVHGGAFAELGCGAGHLAAVLARSADALVAADLLPRAAAMTRIAFALNPAFDGRAGAVVSDVAAALRPRAYAFVAANPPWVPGGGPDGAGPDRIVFAHGGPTGCELPIRFLAEGIELLAPGGVLAMTTLDPTLQDGRRPIVDAVTRLAGRDDLVAWLAPTPIHDVQPGFPHRLLENHPQLAAARHVAVLVARRPGRITADHLAAAADAMGVGR